MKKEYDKKVLELRDYLESFIKRFNGQHLHLIDIYEHLRIIGVFEEDLECLSEYQEAEEEAL